MVTSTGDVRLREKKPVECVACNETFSVLPSRVGTVRRCPECVEAGRYRCTCACEHAELFVEERQGRGSQVLCQSCRNHECWEPGRHGGQLPHPVRQPRSPRLTFKCRGVEIAGRVEQAPTCWGESVITRAKAEALVAKTQRPGAWGTSYRLEDQTWICKACSALPRIVDMARAIADGKASDEVLDELDREGNFIRYKPSTLTQARRVLSVAGRDRKDTLTPPERIDPAARVEKRTAKARHRRNQEARGARGPSPTEIRRVDRITATKWRKGVNIIVSRCAWCGKIQLADGSLKVGPTMHQACMIEAMRSPEGRRWLSDRKTMRDDGLSPHQINRKLGTSMPIGEPSQDPHLQRDFTWAVRHRLGGESNASLAAEAGLTSQAVGKAIRRIEELLPDSELVAKKHRRLIERLRALAST